MEFSIWLVLTSLLRMLAFVALIMSTYTYTQTEQAMMQSLLHIA